MRADIATAWTLSSLRSRGRLGMRLRLLVRSLLPVLVAGFRHSDELATAMDARGFGLHPARTVHHGQRLRARDIIVLVVVWCASLGLALWAERW